jgi:transcriptional regulator with XRE-family HTH domain
MTKARTEYEVAMTAVKAALKRQKITYAELAKRLRISESGLKKILSAKDGSFQRLAQICEELGLSLSELLAGEDQTQEISFTPAQQEFLASHAGALRLFWALVYERRPLPEAEKLAGVNPKEVFSLLRKLDQLGLLELLPANRLRIPAVRPVRWVGDGPLIRKLHREWSAGFVKSVARPTPDKGEQFISRYFRASRRTVDELQAALKDLEAEFLRRAIKEMRTESPDLVHLRWVSAVDDKSYLEVT